MTNELLSSIEIEEFGDDSSGLRIAIDADEEGRLFCADINSGGRITALTYFTEVEAIKLYEWLKSNLSIGQRP